MKTHSKSFRKDVTVTNFCADIKYITECGWKISACSVIALSLLVFLIPHELYCPTRLLVPLLYVPRWHMYL